MKITLPYPPSVNALYASVGRRRVLSKEGREFKATVGILLRKAGVKMVEGDVFLWVKLYRPRKAGDLDNFLKAVQDSLTGIAYRDDSQIVFLNAQRFDDKLTPRCEVEVLEITP